MTLKYHSFVAGAFDYIVKDSPQVTCVEMTPPTTKTQPKNNVRVKESEQATPSGRLKVMDSEEVTPSGSQKTKSKGHLNQQSSAEKRNKKSKKGGKRHHHSDSEDEEQEVKLTGKQVVVCSVSSDLQVKFQNFKLRKC